MAAPLLSRGDDLSDEPSEDFVAALVAHQRQVYAFIATLLPHAADIEDIYQQTYLAHWKKRDLHNPAHVAVSVFENTTAEFLIFSGESCRP